MKQSSSFLEWFIKALVVAALIFVGLAWLDANALHTGDRAPRVENTINNVVAPAGASAGTPAPTATRYDVRGTLNAKRAHDATATADRLARDATREALRETLKTPNVGRD